MNSHWLFSEDAFLGIKMNRGVTRAQNALAALLGMKSIERCQKASLSIFLKIVSFVSMYKRHNRGVTSDVQEARKTLTYVKCFFPC